jgi:tripeptidyl-peptidase-1
LDESISPNPNSSVSAVQLSIGRWRPDDLDAFFEKYAPYMDKRRPHVIGINGGSWQNDIDGIYWSAESNLDFEYIMTLTNRTALNYQVGGLDISWGLKPNLNSLLAAFDGEYCEALENTTDKYSLNQTWPWGSDYRSADCGTIRTLPSVLSISYGWNEADFPAPYLRRQCLQFLKLGLQGVSVIVASGDRGAAGVNGECLKNGRFSPLSPSTCPYVTSVGGTQVSLASESSTHDREIAASWVRGNITGSSGGGFSNVFRTPIYQHDMVGKYLQEQNGSSLHTSQLYNISGRGVPDIAVVGKNFVIRLDGQWKTVDGTSGSAPILASIITLINDWRLNAGKSTVGFLNPVFYTHYSAFHDITKGSSKGCGGKTGFAAGHGWDPVTGLGTPDFEKLLKLYQNLP